MPKKQQIKTIWLLRVCIGSFIEQDEPLAVYSATVVFIGFGKCFEFVFDVLTCGMEEYGQKINGHVNWTLEQKKWTCNYSNLIRLKLAKWISCEYRERKRERNTLRYAKSVVRLMCILLNGNVIPKKSVFLQVLCGDPASFFSGWPMVSHQFNHSMTSKFQEHLRKAFWDVCEYIKPNRQQTNKYRQIGHWVVIRLLLLLGSHDLWLKRICSFRKLVNFSHIVCSTRFKIRSAMCYSFQICTAYPIDSQSPRVYAYVCVFVSCAKIVVPNCSKLLVLCAFFPSQWNN